MLHPRRWLKKHSLKLLAIRDTPEAIAGGVAIGIFFGFTPLFGFKTALAVLFAWLTGSNILAAVIAGALHDIILPFMPVIYRWEYDIGYWLLSSPHQLPRAMEMKKLHWDWDWAKFFAVGKPLLLGSFIVATPFTAISFFISKGIVHRHQLKRSAREAKPPPDVEENPS